MNRAILGLMMPAVSIACFAGCGGSVSNTQSSDGGSDATSLSASGGSGFGSSSGGGTCGGSGEPCCDGTACNNGLSCSGGVCTGSSSGSGGSDGGSGSSSGGSSDGGSVADATLPPLDAALPPLDAALGSLDAAPLGLAGFAFIVNDVVQQPMSCAGTNWEFAPYPGTTTDNGCMPQGGGMCPGIESVILVNTGTIDMAYIAGPWWSGPQYVPGGYPGGDFGAGVLTPGAYVDITAFYNGGLVAIVGSAEPFSTADAAYASDEGTMTWPLGVAGSGGATTMYVAEIEVDNGCQPVFRAWE